MLETIVALTGAVGGAIGLVKGATEVTTDLREMIEKPGGDLAAARELILKLQAQMIQLQATQIAMQGLVMNAQEEQRRLENFAAQVQRYALVQTPMGSFVYELKPECADKEPPHSICAACHQKQIKSILQPVERAMLGCSVCGGKFRDGRGGGQLRTGYDITNPYGD